ncbi:hypothetical protein FB451DRAFT_247213 [Mycena latifolia]|nr:hypothetical protein FB451DRAFT_247213 [Mycena latifolia]
MEMENSTLAETTSPDASTGISMDGGMYVVLIGLAVWFLRQRRPKGTGIFGRLSAVTCVLGTAGLILQVGTTPFWFRILYSMPGDFKSVSDVREAISRTENLILLAKDLFVVSNNTLADVLLTYRCYVLWKSSYPKLVILPILSGIVAAGCGYVLAYQAYLTEYAVVVPDDRLWDGLMAATNLSVTALTVGRILNTRQDLRAIGDTKSIHTEATVTQLLLESAVIYFVGSCAAILAATLGQSMVDGHDALGAMLIHSIRIVLGAGAHLKLIIACRILFQCF